jgi:outer membrane protein assembly factor BamB
MLGWNRLYALDSETGLLRWTFPSDAEPASDVPVKYGQDPTDKSFTLNTEFQFKHGIWSTPAVDNRGKYSRVFVATGGWLVCVEDRWAPATAHTVVELWGVKLYASSEYLFTPGPVLGNLLSVAQDGTPNPATVYLGYGKKFWAVRDDNHPGPDEDEVESPTDERCWGCTGSGEDKKCEGCNPAASADCSGRNSAAKCGGSGGRIKNEATHMAEVLGTAAVHVGLDGVEHVYIGDADTKMRKYTSNLGLVWRFDEPGGSIRAQPVINGMGDVIFGCDDGNLYSIGATEVKRNKLKVLSTFPFDPRSFKLNIPGNDGNWFSSPSITSAGQVVFGTVSGQVNVLGPGQSLVNGVGCSAGWKINPYLGRSPGRPCAIAGNTFDSQGSLQPGCRCPGPNCSYADVVGENTDVTNIESSEKKTRPAGLLHPRYPVAERSDDAIGAYRPCHRAAADGPGCDPATTGAAGRRRAALVGSGISISASDLCWPCDSGSVNTKWGTATEECLMCPKDKWSKAVGSPMCILCDPLKCLEGANCTFGRGGKACASCKDGYYSKGKTCAECPDSSFWNMVLVIFVFGFVMYMVYHHTGGSSYTSGTKFMHELTRLDMVKIKLKERRTARKMVEKTARVVAVHSDYNLEVDRSFSQFKQDKLQFKYRKWDPQKGVYASKWSTGTGLISVASNDNDQDAEEWLLSKCVGCCKFICGGACRSKKLKTKYSRRRGLKTGVVEVTNGDGDLELGVSKKQKKASEKAKKEAEKKEAQEKAKTEAAKTASQKVEALALAAVPGASVAKASQVRVEELEKEVAETGVKRRAAFAAISHIEMDVCNKQISLAFEQLSKERLLLLEEQEDRAAEQAAQQAVAQKNATEGAAAPVAAQMTTEGAANAEPVAPDEVPSLTGFESPGRVRQPADLALGDVQISLDSALALASPARINTDAREERRKTLEALEAAVQARRKDHDAEAACDNKSAMVSLDAEIAALELRMEAAKDPSSAAGKQLAAARGLRRKRATAATADGATSRATAPKALPKALPCTVMVVDYRNKQKEKERRDLLLERLAAKNLEAALPEPGNRNNADIRGRNTSAMQIFGTAFVIAIAYYQMTAVLMESEFQWPPLLLDYRDLFGNFFSLSLPDLMTSPECTWKMLYLEKWLLQVLSPLLFVAACLVWYVVVSKMYIEPNKRRAAQDRCVQTMVILTSVMYVFAASKTLHPTLCTLMPDGVTSFLTGDPSVECCRPITEPLSCTEELRGYKYYYLFSCFMLVLYGGGVPFALQRILTKAKKKNKLSDMQVLPVCVAL